MLKLLAFLVTAIALKPKTAAEPGLPKFAPKPWFDHDKLDARPVAWSLENHPEEWTWGESIGAYSILHIPSKHRFWVANGYGFYRLWSAENCSCTSSEKVFQRGQQGLFGRAFKRWRKAHGTPQFDGSQFAAHFIH